MAQQAGGGAQPQPQTQAVPIRDLVTGDVVGEYRVDGKLGEGGMGAVYSATHPLIGKKAAIKVISPQLCTDQTAVERFVQEARSVNQIGHPNIVDVFAFGQLPDGRSYFVMEHLQGMSLADRVAKGGMTLGEAVEILDQASDVLEAAHEKGIVHRDLKPDNVYLVAVRGNRQLVKLLDFGIAKLAAGDVRVQKTATGMMMGTPGYISPEQARGKSVDHRTDIYAFGCMAYEMILGRLPFVAESAMDVVLAHLTEPPPPPREIWPEIPENLEVMLTRMLEKDPAARPTLIEFRQVLTELRGVIMSTMGAEGSQSFRSGFGPRAVTPAGTPMKFNTPLPGSVPGIGTNPGQRRTPVPGTSSSVVVADDLMPEPAKAGGGKGKIIAIAAVVVIGGAAAAFALMGGKKDTDKTQQAAVLPEKQPEKLPEAPPEKPPEKPPEAPPVAAKGTIVIKVTGSTEASFELDGKNVGSGATATVEVDEGDHQLVVTAPGRKPVTQQISVFKGTKRDVAIKLEREKVAGSGEKKPPGGEKKPPGDKPPGGDKPGDENYTIDPFTGQKIKNK